ncbi:MAG: GWxTD domain-containing protein [Balneolaceae bacterium]
MKLLVTLTFILLIFLPGRQIESQAYTPIHTDSYLEMGQKLVEEGNWKVALRVWIQGLLDEAEPNPELGFSALELAVRQGATDFYPVVSDAFMHSLSLLDYDRYRELTDKQVQSILPLLPDDERSELQTLHEAGKLETVTKLIAFWKKQDPFPSTDYHERLVEHWNRIIYARKHFTLADNSPYGTDDRGTIYVRFGEPHRVIRQSLQLNYVEDPVSGERYQIFSNAMIDVEMWLYSDYTDDRLLYLFGRRNNSGMYRLQTSLVDMLPVQGNQFSGTSFDSGQSSTFSITDSTDQRLATISGIQGSSPLRRNTVAFMIRYGLMQQLSLYHPYFAEIYDDMTSDIISSSASSPGQFNFGRAAQRVGDRYSYREEREAFLRELIAPPFHSDLLHEQNRVTSSYRAFQFFSPDGNPEQWIVLENRHMITDANLATGRLDGLLTLTRYDKEWNELDRSTYLSPALDEISWYSFEGTPQPDENLLYSFEIIHPSGNENDRHWQVLASTGSKSIDLYPPLETGEDRAGFSVSDILFGTFRDSASGRDVITPLFGRPAGAEDEVGIYFETFSNETNRFSVTYFLERKNLFGRWNRIPGRSAVTIQFEKEEARSQNWFLFDLEGLNKREHRIVLEFTADGFLPIVRHLPIPRQ